MTRPRGAAGPLGLVAVAAAALCLGLSGCSNGTPASSPDTAATATAAASRPAVHASEFTTTDGKVTCANAEVQAHLTLNAPLVHADPAQQSVVCFVHDYAGPSAHDECLGLPFFTVRLLSGQYPTTSVCSGEEPKELSPNPRRVAAGDAVNLDGATCRVTAAGVACASNGPGKKTRFTVSSSGIEIPIAAGDEVRFAQSGFADNSAVRPGSLEVSADTSLVISGASYSSWTQRAAAGKGMLERDVCEPDCATGPRTTTPVTFTLDTPVLACGQFFFSRLTWKATTGAQDEQGFDFGPPSADNARDNTTCGVLTT